MTIEVAVEKGCSIQIYGEHGCILGSIPISGEDRLLGYTGSSVSVKKGSFVNVYNEHGACISSYCV